MEIETAIFFSGCTSHLIITIVSMIYMNKLGNRYTHNDYISRQIDKYWCDTLILCIITMLIYFLFTGMIIENILKYKLVATIILMIFFSVIHIIIQIIYISRIREIIHYEMRVVPIVDIPTIASPVMTTSHIQTSSHNVVCTLTHYNNKFISLIIVNPDNSINIANINENP